MSYRDERRQRGLCPVCGERVQLTGDTADKRYIGSCGDAFWPNQWRALGPRTPPRQPPPRMRIQMLLIGEFEVDGQHPLAEAAAQLDAFREAVQPAAEYGVSLYQATAADVAGFAEKLWRPTEVADRDKR